LEKKLERHERDIGIQKKRTRNNDISLDDFSLNFNGTLIRVTIILLLYAL
jgi:hypothetical protein